MSSRIDPNEYAQKLAALSKELSDKTRKDSESIRAGTLAGKSSDPNVVAELLAKAHYAAIGGKLSQYDKESIKVNKCLNKDCNCADCNCETCTCSPAPTPETKSEAPTQEVIPTQEIIVPETKPKVIPTQEVIVPETKVPEEKECCKKCCSDPCDCYEQNEFQDTCPLCNKKECDCFETDFPDTSIPEITERCECGEPIDMDGDNVCDICDSTIETIGIKLDSEDPVRNDNRLDDEVVVNNINEKRDKKIGIPLSKVNLNYTFDKPDTRDVKFMTIFKGEINPKYLPKWVDLRTHIGSPLNQFDIGSCVSNSVAYCLRYCVSKQSKTKSKFNPSRLFIYYNGRVVGGQPVNKDTGLSIRSGFKSVSKYSCCKEEVWPYITYKYSQKPSSNAYSNAATFKNFQYINLDSDINQFKKCLKDGYPISFGAALFQSFMSQTVSKTGIVPVPNQATERRAGGHAMTIVGYSDRKKAFLVLNSWGKKWGWNGYCWFPYEYMMNKRLVSDFWSPRWFS